MKLNCPHCDQGPIEVTQHMETMMECPACHNLFYVPATLDELRQYCPACHALSEPQALLCIQCGYNFKTGAKIAAAPIVEEHCGQARVPLWLKPLHFVAEYFPGLFSPFPLLAALICFGLALFIAFFSLIIMSMMVISGIAMASSALIIYLQGVAILMVGSVESLKSAMVELKGGKWDLFVLIGLAPVIIVILVMMIVHRLSLAVPVAE